MTLSSESRNPIDELAEQFIQQRRDGQQVEIEEFARSYPELADEIRDVFPTLLLLENLKPDSQDVKPPAPSDQDPNWPVLADYRILRQIARGGMGIVYEAEQVSLGRRVALKVMPQDRTGDPESRRRFENEARSAAGLHHSNIVPVYEVGQENETCYYAMQYINGQGLDQIAREVEGLLNDGKPADSNSGSLTGLLARSIIRAPNIRTEAEQDSGQSQTTVHPAIAQRERESISARQHQQAMADGSEADAESGAFRDTVDKAQLDESTVVSSVFYRNYFRSVAKIGVQVAMAIEYAHQRGVIHRDIKPANLLLDVNGAIWVSDFGLAKLENEALTRTGDIVGTLRYMAPERFDGQCDARSDVYSLGLTLYEMLSLRPAFSADGHLSLIESIRNHQPRLLRTINPRIPRDLQTIVCKAMEKEPARRYENANSLADDLDRFLAGQPIRARRVQPLERLWLWAKKRKPLATALACITLLLLAGTISSSFAAAYFFQKEKEQSQLVYDKTELANEKTALADRMRSQRNTAFYNSYIADMHVARADLEAGNVSRMLKILSQYLPKPDQLDVRDWEWYYLLGQANQDKLTIPCHDELVTCVRYSPDGSIVASVSADNTLQLHRVLDGKQILKTEIPGARKLAFEPNGNRLATVGEDPVVRIWSVPDGKLIRAIRRNMATFNDVDWSRDGSKIVICSNDENQIEILNPNDGSQIDAFRDTTRPAHAEFSADGTLLATGYKPINIWDLKNKKIIYSHGQDHANFEVFDLAWHPQSHLLALGFYNNRVQFLDVDQRKLTTSISERSAVQAIAFNRDGTQLACATRGQRVQTYDVASGRRLNSFQGHIGWVKSVAFHPNQMQLVSGGHDGQIKIWDASPKRKADVNAPPSPFSVASPDGKLRAVGAGIYPISIRDVATGQELFELSDEAEIYPLTKISWDESGSFLIADTGKTIAAWSMKTGELHSRLHYANGNAHAVAPGGVLVAFGPHPFMGGKAGLPLKIWDPINAKITRRIHAHANGVFGLAFSPDGKRLASVGAGDVKIWDVASGKELVSMYGHAPGHWLIYPDWSPDGSLLATGGWDQKVKIWDSKTGDERFTLEGHTNNVFSVAFSPSGSRLVSGSGNGTVKLWDVAFGREVATLHADETRTVHRAVWAKDGHSFVVKDAEEHFGTRFDSLLGRRAAADRLFVERFRRAERILRRGHVVKAFQAQSLRKLAETQLINPGDMLFDPRLGLEAAERAVALQPGSPEFLTTLALGYLRNERWRDALEALGNTVSLDPGSVRESGFLLAMTQANLENYPLAIEWYIKAEEAVLAQPTTSIYDRLQSEADALIAAELLKRCDRELSESAGDLKWLRRAARWSLRFGETDEAIKHLTAITDRDPNNFTELHRLAMAHSTRGEAARSQDRLEPAADDWSRANSLFLRIEALAKKEQSIPELDRARKHLSDHIIRSLVNWKTVETADFELMNGIEVGANGAGRITLKTDSRMSIEPVLRFKPRIKNVSGVRVEFFQDSARIFEAQFSASKADGDFTRMIATDVFASTNETGDHWSSRFYATGLIDGKLNTDWSAGVPTLNAPRGMGQSWVVFEFADEPPMAAQRIELASMFGISSDVQIRISVTDDQTPASVERFRRLIEHHHVNSTLRLAVAYLLSGDKPKVNKLLEEFESGGLKTLSNADVLVMARLHVELGNLTKARQLLARAAANLEDRPLGFVLQFIANTHELAIPAKPDKSDAKFIFEQAELRARLNQNERALKLVNQAIDLSNADETTLSKRAWLHVRLQRLDDAIADYRQLTTLSPKNYDNHLRLAALLLRTKKFVAYERFRDDLLETIIQEKPIDSRAAIACLLLPAASAEQGNQEPLTKGIVDSEFHSEMSIRPVANIFAAYRSGKYEEALAKSDVILALETQYVGFQHETALMQTSLLRALTLQKLGREADAKKALQQALKWMERRKPMLDESDLVMDWLGYFIAEQLLAESALPEVR